MRSSGGALGRDGLAKGARNRRDDQALSACPRDHPQGARRGLEAARAHLPFSARGDAVTLHAKRYFDPQRG